MNDLISPRCCGRRPGPARVVIAWARQWGRAGDVLFEPDLLALVLAAAAGWHDPRPVEAWAR